MRPNDNYRRAHIVADRESRLAKGRKIESILSKRTQLAGKRLLDIGAGSGYISKYFKNMGLDVVAADRERNLADDVDITFCQTTGISLPFDSASFDIVIYNHVIEHVGERFEQRGHLAEIHRVLKSEGMLYLAVPNRWSLVEPHYKLPLLSWLPKSVASSYVRISGRGTWYDCLPFGARELRQALGDTGFAVEDVTFEALDFYLKYEAQNSWPFVIGRHIPSPVLKLSAPIIPTLIFVGAKRTE